MIDIGEDVEIREPFFPAGANVSWYSYTGEQCGDSLKNYE